VVNIGRRERRCSRSGTALPAHADLGADLLVFCPKGLNACRRYTAGSIFLYQANAENASCRQFLFPAEQKIVCHMRTDFVAAAEHDGVCRVRPPFQPFGNAVTECNKPGTGKDRAFKSPRPDQTKISPLFPKPVSGRFWVPEALGIVSVSCDDRGSSKRQTPAVTEPPTSHVESVT
jgi:hypothetical protein